jgi:NAD+ synthase (glutamine-hydrolysing)
MKLIKVAGAALNQTPRDWKNNISNILEAIRQAKEQNVSVLCLPELSCSGYGLEDDHFCLDVPHRSLLKLAEIAPFCTDMIVCIGLPIRFNNTLYNAVAMIVNGYVEGFTCKQHLANDGIFYEDRWFHPWPQGIVQQIYIPELKHLRKSGYVYNTSLFPIGDTHFDIGGVKLGFEICEDSFVANRPGIILASKGIDIILNPSASNFSFGKLNIRKNLVVDGSRAFGCTYIYANLVGNEAGRIIFDGGTLIASEGKLLAQGKRFTYQNVLLTTAIVDIDNTRTSQIRTSSFQPDIKGYNYGCINVTFTYPEVTEKSTETLEEPWETSEYIKHEECTRALGLALMDYMRKSHTKGFVVSLSGGADSAMVTYACVMGIKLAIKELGIAKFISKYCPHLGEGARCSNFYQWTEEEQLARITSLLITTAYQATENSGEVTKTAAREIAIALNVSHYELDVQPMFEEYCKLGKFIKKGTDLTFEQDDIVLQNLQARVRAPGIWMIANMEGKLLLTTSNMSEGALGYFTMDGDSCGSVAPIAGLPKVYIRQYLRWIEDSGTLDFGCLREMSLITKQEPTAELRPIQYKQTDEDDLMPYWLLHLIEVYVVKNRYTPVEIYKAIKRDMDYDNNKLINDITKFFTLLSRNQWKRERTAISFHMDDHNLDPKTWCRMPVLNSGYKEELEELKKYII